MHNDDDRQIFHNDMSYFRDDRHIFHHNDMSYFRDDWSVCPTTKTCTIPGTLGTKNEIALSEIHKIVLDAPYSFFMNG